MYSKLEFGMLNSQLLYLAVEISSQADVTCSKQIRAPLGKLTDKSLHRHKDDVL